MHIQQNNYEGTNSARSYLDILQIQMNIVRPYSRFYNHFYFEAKNEKLAQHYSEMLGASRVPSRIHEYRMELLEEHAQKIIERYTLEGDFNDDSN